MLPRISLRILFLATVISTFLQTSEEKVAKDEKINLFKSGNSFAAHRISRRSVQNFQIDQETVISSPRLGNGYYDNDMQVTWTVTSPPNKRPLLTFVYFSLEPQRRCTFDKVKVEDSSGPLGVFCGTSPSCSNFPVSKILSEYPTMNVTFTSDVSVSFQGFDANITFVDANWLQSLPRTYRKKRSAELVTNSNETKVSIESLASGIPPIPETFIRDSSASKDFFTATTSAADFTESTTAPHKVDSIDAAIIRQESTETIPLSEELKTTTESVTANDHTLDTSDTEDPSTRATDKSIMVSTSPERSSDSYHKDTTEDLISTTAQSVTDNFSNVKSKITASISLDIAITEAMTTTKEIELTSEPYSSKEDLSASSDLPSANTMATDDLDYTDNPASAESTAKIAAITDQPVNSTSQNVMTSSYSSDNQTTDSELIDAMTTSSDPEDHYTTDAESNDITTTSATSTVSFAERNDTDIFRSPTVLKSRGTSPLPDMLTTSSTSAAEPEDLSTVGEVSVDHSSTLPVSVTSIHMELQSSPNSPQLIQQNSSTTELFASSPIPTRRKDRSTYGTTFSSTSDETSVEDLDLTDITIETIDPTQLSMQSTAIPDRTTNSEARTTLHNLESQTSVQTTTTTTTTITTTTPLSTTTHSSTTTTEPQPTIHPFLTHVPQFEHTLICVDDKVVSPQEQEESVLCGGVLIASSEVRTISSPQFGEDEGDLYPIDMNCEWTISTDVQNQVVVLRFVYFALEHGQNCAYDSVTVTTDVSNPLGFDSTNTLCGTGGNCQNYPRRTFVSQGDRMMVRFRSDSSNNFRGFKAEYFLGALGYEAVDQLPEFPPGQNCIAPVTTQPVLRTFECTNMLHPRPSEMFGVPFSNMSYYGNNLNCTWSLDAPEDKWIDLKFSSFHVEPGSSGCNYDGVDVYHKNWTLLDQFCGQLGTRYLKAPKPEGLLYKGNGLFMIFRSDSSVTFTGFKANFQAVPQQQVAAPPIP